MRMLRSMTRRDREWFGHRGFVGAVGDGEHPAAAVEPARRMWYSMRMKMTFAIPDDLSRRFRQALKVK